MINGGVDARRRRHRPRHRVLSQPAVARLQDRARASSPTCWRSSICSKTRCARSASSSGRWWSSRPTTRWRPAAALAARDTRVERVVICTPDKDLAQCVRGTRVVQLESPRANVTRDEAGVIAKFGVPPASIPDYLALVGDAADGYPGLARLGRRSRPPRCSRKFGHLEAIPDDWRDVARQRRQRGDACRARSSASATTRCSFATWRRCVPTSRCLRRSTSSSGTARRRRSRRSRRGSTRPPTNNAIDVLRKALQC